MPQTLYIFSANPELADATSGWSWHDSGGKYSGQGNDTELRNVVVQLAENTTIYLLLPTEELFLSSVDIPARQAQQIRQAAPFAIEEF